MEKNRLDKTIEQEFLENRILYLSGDITHEEAMEILFRLRTLEEKKIEPIKLYLSIQEISYRDALMLYDGIKLLHSEVHSYALGVLTSFSFFLFLAGTKRFILPHSYANIDRFEFSRRGQKNFLRGYKEYESKIKSYLKEITQEKSSSPLEEDFLSEDIFWTAKDLYDLGLATNYVGG